MKKSGSGAETKRKKAKTSVAGTSWETRQVVAEWAMAAKASGTPVRSFAKNGEKSSYSPSARTLRRQVASLERGEDLFMKEKDTGREPTLLWDQRKVLCGAVLMAKEKVKGTIKTRKKFFLFFLKLSHTICFRCALCTNPLYE
jgi:hypothetical protein